MNIPDSPRRPAPWHRRRTAWLASLAALAALALPLAAAHGIEPDPSGTEFRVLLQDRADDCGPEAAAAQDCHGAHALVGLALQERGGQGGPALVFRLFMDKGTGGSLVDTFTFKANGAAKAITLRTSDDRSFTGEGFDTAHGFPYGDGTRFAVDVTTSAAHLGLQEGQQVTDFKVVSTSGGSQGDVMPGSCTNTLGGCTGGDTSTEYILGGGTGRYTLTGPTYYATLDAPSGTQDVTEGGTIVMLNIANQLRLAQTFQLTVSAPDSVAAGFHVGSLDGAEYKDHLAVDLNGKGSAGSSTVVHLQVKGLRAEATGSLTVSMTSDKGGANTKTVAFHVVPSGATSTGTSDTPSPPTSKGSPAAGMAGILALCGAALKRRV